MKRTSPAIGAAIVAAIATTGCASAPLPPPVAVPAGPPFEVKQAWILRLEDTRVLRDPAPIEPAVPPPVVPARGQKAAVAPPPPPPPLRPDLLRLLEDGEARIRRRAALAVGRVGLREGVPALVALLGDVEAEVRQMAAFALGLLGDAGARDPLVAALDDPSPLMKGSAAEALGLLGDPSSAAPIARMAGAIVDSGALASLPDEELEGDRSTPAAAVRLALAALVRLKAYDALASAVLDGVQPKVRWWPVAYALQRIEDPRALPALLMLAGETHPYTRAFAAKGLGALNDPSAVPVLLPLVSGPDPMVAVEAIRSLGRLGDAAAAPVLQRLITGPRSDPRLRLDAIAAIAGLRADGVFETLLDVLADPSPPVRAAAIRGLAARDPDAFLTVLSSLDPDPHWSVRAALAGALSTLAPEVGEKRLTAMMADEDERVLPAVLEGLARLKAPGGAATMIAALQHTDPIVRAAAAAGLGELKPPDGASHLAEAYRAGERDLAYNARAAALEALARYGPADAGPVLEDALDDKDWAVRVRAAELLDASDPEGDAGSRIRPAPSQHPAELYESPRIVDPPVSTQVYLETDHGLIQIELAVLDAPLTSENFVTLARRKAYDGVTFHRVVTNFVVQGGDPRGDSQGGPGYTIRDEINQRPYLRGSVGMALDWKDTGGSQFFIAQSPQPHLDARYTVFGRVTRGMEIVDRIQPWDVIRRVLVWDGQELR